MNKSEVSLVWVRLHPRGINDGVGSIFPKGKRHMCRRIRFYYDKPFGHFVVHSHVQISFKRTPAMFKKRKKKKTKKLSKHRIEHMT